jgi:bifunctional non-homologous end joining protein LigD
MARPASEYNKKRNFDITPEPPEEEVPRRKKAKHALRFVIQKHEARGLHYDFRLELEDTLKSWAVPKGPSLDPTDKRMAIQTEDHPLSYAEFEGHIPAGEYGGGHVIVWDHGIWQPHDEPVAAFNAGKIKFTLIGEKLSGDWMLVKTRGYGNSKKENWLLIKERDEVARPSAEYSVLIDRPESVISGDLLPIDKNEKVKTNIADAKSKKNINPKVKAAVKETLKQPSAKDVDETLNKKPVKSASAKLPPAVKKRPGPIPEMISPQLATLVNEPPEGDWLYEIKFDGYRMLARVLKGKVNLFTRSGHDWTERLPIQAKAIEALKLQDSWLDGEVVVLDENGLPSFQALQNAFDAGLNHDIIFYLFDAPYLNGFDLRESPLQERREALQKVLSKQKNGPLRYSAVFDADHKSIVESACALSLEGVIGKRAGSTYVSRRSNDWIKLKCRLRQEFVIVGYTEPKGSRNGFGAILLGVHKNIGDPELIYAGRVGTGFNEARLRDIYKKMHALERDTPPVSTKLSSEQKRGAHWIEPKLICEVEFAEWTNEGILRQGAFISLRTDKPAKDIIRERPKTVPDSSTTSKLAKKSVVKSAPVPKKASTESKSKNGKVDVAGVGISHPERVLDTESGITKLELAQFYESIGEFILPHLSHRPVSLLRAPDGIEGEQFFQKHSENMAIPHITQLDQSLDPTHGRLMQIDSVDGLVGCTQMNTIELHTWGATTAGLEMPDRFTLDLDPDPALPWRSVVEATRLTLSLLDELKLQAFIKTTGGKGMHLVVPLTPDAGWDYVKAFSKAVAEFMSKQIPERFVAKMGPKNRIGKIFIDYLRNSRGASTVCAYSVRARPGLAVSVPIARNELEKLSHSDQWNTNNLHKRLESLKEDPWGDYSGGQYKKKQKISKAMWKKMGLAEPLKSGDE